MFGSNCTGSVRAKRRDEIFTPYEDGFYRNIAGIDPATIAFAESWGLGDFVRGHVQDEPAACDFATRVVSWFDEHMSAKSES
jgi:hypothetical protein